MDEWAHSDVCLINAYHTPSLASKIQNIIGLDENAISI